MKASNRKKTAKATSPYDEACQYLQTSWKTGHSLRSLVYDKERLLCSKRTFAIVSNVLKHEKLLKDLLKQQDLMESVDNKALLYILAYELLLSKQRRITGGGAIKRILLSHHDELLARLQQSHPEIAASHESSNAEHDTNLSEPIIKPYHFRLLVPATGETHHQDVSEIVSASTKDPLLPNVYETTIPKAKLIPHSDAIIIQSQASCLPAICMKQCYKMIQQQASDSLNHCFLLDACAAPGNKTLQLAEYFPSCTILALDKDPARYETLKRRCRPHSHIQTQLQDFLTFRNDSISAILLDPSCSGGHAKDGSNDDERIESLAQFQTKCLSHALSNFPQCSTVVYSTCSHTITENEAVVGHCLKEYPAWTLTPALPEWKMRGNSVLSEQEQANACLRHSDGFFVAVFQRATTMLPKKKRLKKRLWKARQHEAKRKRMATAKSTSKKEETKKS